VLIGTQRRARLLGIVMHLAAPSLPVAKLLRLTGLDRSLTIHPDLRGALSLDRPEPVRAAISPRVLAG
jgi:anti-anti-sigma regulatory factor